MSWETTFLGKIFSFGFGAWKRNKDWEKFDEIVKKYGLEGCDSADELESKINRMYWKDEDHIRRMMPDLKEYIKHARNYPGTPYYSRK